MIVINTIINIKILNNYFNLPFFHFKLILINFQCLITTLIKLSYKKHKIYYFLYKIQK